MGNYTPLVSHSVSFDGDLVTMNIRRLKRADMMKLLPYLSERTNANGETETVVAFSSQAELFDVVSEMLKGYVTNFTGLKMADGENVSLENALDEAYYIPLVSDIVAKLIEVSQLDEADTKNSPAPRGAARRG